LLLLRVAAEALDSAGPIEDPQSTGAIIGIALDPNTTNFDFRWAQRPEQRDAAGPPLTADRVMGNLGSIAASRLARAFDFGGPALAVDAADDLGDCGAASAMVSLVKACVVAHHQRTHTIVRGGSDSVMIHSGNQWERTQRKAPGRELSIPVSRLPFTFRARLN